MNKQCGDLLWCDAFIPEDCRLERGPGRVRITGLVRIERRGLRQALRRHDDWWRFSLIFPFSALGPADVEDIWSDLPQLLEVGLLPASDANGWLGIDLKKHKIEMRLGQ
jgi:hypothetical protein